MKTSDFFFGQMYTEDGTPCISLPDLLTHATRVPQQYFARQLNRISRTSKNNLLVVWNETSSPSFDELLFRLDPAAVGMVVIGARTDINRNVPVTLDCSLYLDEGVVNIRPHWCAYKEMRAAEIISTLLSPILLYGLFDRTYLKLNSEKDLVVATKDFAQLIKTVMRLAGSNHTMLFDDRAFSAYTRQLQIADDICAEGIPWEKRGEEWSRRLRMMEG